jgi:hypothetical protein
VAAPRPRAQGAERKRSAAPAAAVLEKTLKPRLVPTTRASVSPNEPTRSATIATAAAMQSPPTRAQPARRRSWVRSGSAAICASIGGRPPQLKPAAVSAHLSTHGGERAAFRR